MRTLTGVIEKLEIILLPVVNGKEAGDDKPVILSILKFFSFVLKNSIHKRYFLILEVSNITTSPFLAVFLS